MRIKKSAGRFLGVIGVISAMSLTACQGLKADRADQTDQTEQPVNESVSYAGEYHDIYDEPNLEIRKNDDGTYLIQIGIIRLAEMDDCVGYETEEGLEFSVNDWDWGNGPISGIITLDGDNATVQFTAGWIEEESVYSYHKTSDVPNIR